MEISGLLKDPFIHTALRCALVSGQEVKLNVSSGSMRPVITPGDIITVKGIGNSTLHPGDIILCCSKGNLFIHRFLYARRTPLQDYVITKGDTCIKLDAALPAEDVLGKVVSIQKRLCRLNMQSPWWQVYNCVISFVSSAQAWTVKAIRGY